MESDGYDVGKSMKVRNALTQLMNDRAREEFGGRAIKKREIKDGVKLTLEDGSSVWIRKGEQDGRVFVYIEAQTPKELEELRGAVNRFLGRDLGYKA